jgi:thioredoxin 1
MPIAKTDDASFEKDVISSALPVIVDVWAEQCARCEAIGPTLERLSTELESKAKIVKLNFHENPRTVVAFKVRALPTLMLFKDGMPVARKIGAACEDDLTHWLGAHA